MRLGDKLRTLRELEGTCRGLSRALSKAEVVKLIREEAEERISLPYLSQLDQGARAHLTNKTGPLRARCWTGHPGYLVDDPEECHETLGSPVGGRAQTLSSWLRVGASLFRHDPLVSETLSHLAAHPERRKALRLLHAMLGMPVLMDRLLQTLEVKRR